MKSLAVGVAPLLAALVPDVAAVVHMPLHARPHLHPSLSKRQFSTTLQNYIPGLQYFVAAQVGTPPQDVELIVDTGSSDLWFFAPDVCQSTQGHDCIGGTYDSSKSSTYKLVDSGSFDISYADGSEVQGDYISDVFYLGGMNITGAQGAVARTSKGITAPLMGVGFDTYESSVGEYGTSYPNVPDMLVSEGLIKTKAFSLYLDDLESADGVLLFGGYDPAKFYGDLKMMKMIEDDQTGIVDQYLVQWTSFVIDQADSDIELAGFGVVPATVLLDSGTNHIYFPTNLFNALTTFFNISSNGLIACTGISAGQLDFGIGGSNGPIISVPFSELVIPVYNPDGTFATDSSGTRVCSPGFLDSGSNSNDLLIFGQPFLRSAYVLYDLANKQIGLAQARYNSTTSNVIEYTGSNTQNIVQVKGGGMTISVPASAATIAPSIYAFSTQATVSAAPTPVGSLPSKEPSLTQVAQAAGRPTSQSGGTIFAVCFGLLVAVFGSGVVFL